VKPSQYRNRYEPPEEDMVATDDGASNTPYANSPEVSFTNVDTSRAEFYTCLLERNVDFEAVPDDGTVDINGEKIGIKAVILTDLPKPSTIEEEREDRVPCTLCGTTGQAKDEANIRAEEEEKCWKADLEKCEGADEAIFQRTIMINVIDRHKLDPELDWVCESAWTCMRMPQKISGALSQYQTAPPKPDLAVAFKTKSIIDKTELIDLGFFKGHMCAELAKEANDGRAFHFFWMEVKGAQGDLANRVAYCQNFNTASQGLHNMYVFMKKADKEDDFLQRLGSSLLSPPPHVSRSGSTEW
jgi:hypothetical protein